MLLTHPAQLLLGVDADIIVLHECGDLKSSVQFNAGSTADAAVLLQQLYNAGYDQWRPADVCSPTVVLARCKIDSWDTLKLSRERGAVLCTLMLQGKGGVCRDVLLYGTHLDHKHGSKRKARAIGAAHGTELTVRCAGGGGGAARRCEGKGWQG